MGAIIVFVRHMYFTQKRSNSVRTGTVKLISYTNFAHLTLKYSLDSNFNKNTFHLLIGIIFNNLEPFKESVFYEFFLHKKALPWYT